MSDTSYTVFQHYGTAAQRAAFTPSPPATGQPIYIWKQTDAGLGTYLYDTAWHQIAGAGGAIQTVNTQTGAVATGTTTIPNDDTIPQNTEGTEFMTLAVTPTSATNKLRIDVVWQGTSNTNSTGIIVALFQDSTANALATGSFTANASFLQTTTFSHYMTAGTTSATTFKVRAGPDQAATVTFNGVAAGRKFGGVMASSITITEILV
jgi:hypothetical protein